MGHEKRVERFNKEGKVILRVCERGCTTQQMYKPKKNSPFCINKDSEQVGHNVKYVR